jgi:hypothetical protein
VISYTPTTDYVGNDTLLYLVDYFDGYHHYMDTARILIRVVDYPDNVNEANCVIDPETQEWNVQRLQQIDSLSTTQAFVVGDLNGDGYPEIVSYGAARTSIRVIWGPDFATNSKYPLSAAGTGTIAIAKVKTGDAPETYQSMIYYQSDGKLCAIKPNGDPAWSSNPVCRNISGMTGVADFNNDGWAEVYVGNEIYDAATGNLLCDGSATENSGNTYVITTLRPLSMAIDILGDEKLELVAGNKIYEVDIDRNVSMAKPLTLLSSVTPPTNCPDDGLTVVADFNNDGKLEVLVRTKEKKDAWASSKIHLYLWSPHTGSGTGSILAATTDQNVFLGVPFVGDIDGDGNVEVVTLESNSAILVTQSGAFKARKYNASTGSFDLFWEINHTDQSGATGMTLFDFNNDGVAEIVYRDEMN